MIIKKLQKYVFALNVTKYLLEVDISVFHVDNKKITISATQLETLDPSVSYILPIDHYLCIALFRGLVGETMDSS